MLYCPQCASDTIMVPDGFPEEAECPSCGFPDCNWNVKGDNREQIQNAEKTKAIQALKHGCKPVHKAKSGRTGSVHSKKLKSMRG